MVLADVLCGFCLLVCHFFFFSSFLYVLCLLLFLVHEGFSDGGGVHGISFLYVLKAIMSKIGLSQKEAPIGISKRPEIVNVFHFF